MTPAEFARLSTGAILVRRFDKSRWKVIRVTVTPREDRGSNHMLGPVVEAVLRRVSPEIVRTCEPLTWDFAKQEQEVA